VRGKHLIVRPSVLNLSQAAGQWLDLGLGVQPIQLCVPGYVVDCYKASNPLPLNPMHPVLMSLCPVGVC
jgi:hypothetical protein